MKLTDLTAPVLRYVAAVARKNLSGYYKVYALVSEKAKQWTRRLKR